MANSATDQIDYATFLGTVVKNMNSALDVGAMFSLPFEASVFAFSIFAFQALAIIGLMVIAWRSMTGQRTEWLQWSLQIFLIACMMITTNVSQNDSRIRGTLDSKFQAPAGGGSYAVPVGVLYMHMMTSFISKVVIDGMDRASGKLIGTNGNLSPDVLTLFNRNDEVTSRNPDTTRLLNDYQRLCGGVLNTDAGRKVAEKSETAWPSLGLAGGRGLGMDAGGAGYRDSGTGSEPTMFGFAMSNILPRKYFPNMIKGEGEFDEARSQARSILQQQTLGACPTCENGQYGYRVVSKDLWGNLLSGSPSAARVQYDLPPSSMQSGAADSDGVPYINKYPEYKEWSANRWFPKNCLELHDIADQAMKNYYDAKGVNIQGKMQFADFGTARRFGFMTSYMSGQMAKHQASDQRRTDRGDTPGSLDKLGNTFQEEVADESVGLLGEIGNWINKWLAEFGIYTILTIMVLAYALLFTMAPAALAIAGLPGRGGTAITLLQFFVFIQLAMIILYGVIMIGNLFMVGIYYCVAASSAVGLDPGYASVVGMVGQMAVFGGAVYLPFKGSHALVFGDFHGLARIRSDLMARSVGEGAAVTSGVVKAGVSGAAGVVSGAGGVLKAVTPTKSAGQTIQGASTGWTANQAKAFDQVGSIPPGMRTKAEQKTVETLHAQSFKRPGGQRPAPKPPQK